MKVLKIPLMALVYLSIATVIAEGAALAVVWTKGNLNQDTLFQVLAVANDVDLPTVRRKHERANSTAPPVFASMQEVEDMRNSTALDLSMREIAIDKGLVDIREISSQFNIKWNEYKALKDGFDVDFERIRQGAKDESVKDIQRQLESLHPKHAKTQILKILDDPSLNREEAVQDVVAAFKGMSIKNRKRIIEEFRVADAERLHEILRQIRKGEPDVGLFRETRRNLNRFD